MASRSSYNCDRLVWLESFQDIAAYLDAVIRKDASAVDRFFAPDGEYMVNGTPVTDPAPTLPPISVAHFR